MKKKLFISLLTVSIAISAFISIKAYSDIKRNALFFDNLEALADSESGGEFCYNAITTAEGRFVRFCGTCAVVPGKPAFLSGTGYCQ